MKDYKFCSFYFKFRVISSSAQADYNKIDEKQKMEFERVLPKSKRPRYEGLSTWKRS
jgi:hypothetical protein